MTPQHVLFSLSLALCSACAGVASEAAGGLDAGASASSAATQSAQEASAQRQRVRGARDARRPALPTRLGSVGSLPDRVLRPQQGLLQAPPVLGPLGERLRGQDPGVPSLPAGDGPEAMPDSDASQRPSQRPAVPVGGRPGARPCAPLLRSCAVVQRPEPAAVCPWSRSKWASTPQAWELGVLVIGDRDYSPEQVAELLRGEPGSDTSLVLAAQLVAAELNLAAGAEGAPVVELLDEAHDLIGSLDDERHLPLGLSFATDAGKDAVSIALELAAWNSQPCR